MGLHSFMPTVPWSKIMHTERKTTDLTKNDVDKILHICKGMYPNTDMGEAIQLEQNRYMPVFLSCSMMRGGSQYAVIEHIHRTKDDAGLSASPYAFTEERYEVWQTKDGKDSIPVALTSKAKKLSPFSGTLKTVSKRGRIKGRLYWIRTDLINKLDKVRKNGVHFRRKEVNILLPYREQIGCVQSEETVHTVRAWMYLGRHKHWDNKLNWYDMDRCRIYDYVHRSVRISKYKSIEYFIPPKKWMNEPFYFFNAWEIANK